MTDDEKSLFKNIEVEESIRLGHENMKDLIAIGFDPSKTFIFSSMNYMGCVYCARCDTISAFHFVISTFRQCPNYYQNIVRISKCVTFNQVKGIFGFGDSDGIGKIIFPAVQVAPALSTTFPLIFGDKKVPVLIPCGEFKYIYCDQSTVAYLILLKCFSNRSRSVL